MYHIAALDWVMKQIEREKMKGKKTQSQLTLI